MPKSVFSPRQRSLLTALYCKTPSMTKQSEKDSTDLNKILSRYYPSGQLPLANLNPSDSVNDLTGEFDFRSMLDTIRSANRAFSELPAPLRKRFHSPELLLEFCSDNANYDEAVRLGLVEKLNQKNINFESGRPSEEAPKSEGAAPA